MSILPVIRNQVGGTMVMVMIAFSAVGAGAFMVGDMFIKNDDVLRRDARTEAYRHLVESVRKNLHVGNNCTNVLGSATGNGRSIAAALSPGIGAQITMSMNLTDGPARLMGDMTNIFKAKTGTSVKRIFVQLVKPGRKDPVTGLESMVRLTLSPGNTKLLKAGFFRVIIEPDHRGINVWKKKKDASGKDTNEYLHEDLFIPIYAYYDATTSEIYSCFDPASDATFCTEVMKGAYNHDPAITSEKRCLPDLQCFQASGGVLDVGVDCEPPYKELKIGKDKKFCTWCHEIPIGGTVIARVQAQYAGDLEGLTCDSSGLLGSGYTGLEAFKMQEIWGERIPMETGDNPDADLAGGLATCQATEVACVDDPNMPPSGPMGTPTADQEGGADGNFCRNDCPPYNNKGGPYCNSAGMPCPGDNPATACEDECNGVAITADPDPSTCENECTGETSACSPPPDTSGGATGGTSGETTGGTSGGSSKGSGPCGGEERIFAVDSGRFECP
jgi:hypothetical protein